MIALVKVGLNPAMCVLSATLGNTIGGMTCYYMGRLGKIDWIEKYFKVKKEKVDKMQAFLQGKGALPPIVFPNVAERTHMAGFSPTFTNAIITSSELNGMMLPASKAEMKRPK